MEKIQFIKEPGYIYDLFFLFVLYFNKDDLVKRAVNYNKYNEDTEYYNKLLEEYTISEDVLPFFYLKENNKCFMSFFYHEPYENEFTGDYNLARVQSELLDYDQVERNLLRFYFPKITEEKLLECKNSVVAAGRLVKESNYSSDVKNGLYAFFLEPAATIQKLTCELAAKETILGQWYGRKQKYMMRLQQEFDYESVAKKLLMGGFQETDLSSFSNIMISFCLVNKNCIKYFLNEQGAILVLGSDYLDVLDYLINENQLPGLDVFGNALSEKNRIEILELIAQMEEVTIRDIEQQLGFTGTNAYYHLSLMIKANMVKTRNRGRTILYSLNKEYFDVVCGILSKFSSSGKGGAE